MTKLVHVAVGVIVNADGKILIAKRPLAAHQGGLWEFPGGKVDAGESIEQALVRELREELAIDVLTSEPLIQIRHHYPDKSVLLDVRKVTRFNGEPRGNEGQPVQWVDASRLSDFEFPTANRPIITAINLPSRYLITGEFSDDVDFSARLSSALSTGVGLVQLRLENFELNQHRALFDRALLLTKRASASLVVNTSAAEYSRICKAYPDVKIGLHLNGKHAADLNERSVEKNVLLGVSCHNEAEIIHAQRLGADYLLISPVLPTRSHPDAISLGWNEFASLVELANVPVYALGGVGEEHVHIAQECGAQGVAGISAWWRD